jgi:hypothetical protein
MSKRRKQAKWSAAKRQTEAAAIAAILQMPLVTVNSSEFRVHFLFFSHCSELENQISFRDEDGQS